MFKFSLFARLIEDIGLRISIPSLHFLSLKLAFECVPAVEAWRFDAADLESSHVLIKKLIIGITQIFCIDLLLKNRAALL